MVTISNDVGCWGLRRAVSSCELGVKAPNPLHIRLRESEAVKLSEGRGWIMRGEDPA